jgi:hypothetical protein
MPPIQLSGRGQGRGNGLVLFGSILLVLQQTQNAALLGAH